MNNKYMTVTWKYHKAKYHDFCGSEGYEPPHIEVRIKTPIQNIKFLLSEEEVEKMYSRCMRYRNKNAFVGYAKEEEDE